MNLWQPTVPIPTVSYNRNFAVLELKDAVASLMELSAFNSENEDYQRAINQTALALLNRLRQLSQEQSEKISDAIESSNPVQEAKEKAMLESIVDNEGQYQE